jgi:hypothetical protein
MLADIAFVLIRRVAEIISGPINNITHSFGAFEVFIGLETISVGSTFVFPSAIHGDAGVALANVMFLAIIVGDAFVVSISGNDDTGS